MYLCVYVCARVCMCVLACAGQGRSVGGQTCFLLQSHFLWLMDSLVAPGPPLPSALPGAASQLPWQEITRGSVGLQQSPSTEGMAKTHVGEEEDCSRPAQLLKMCQENEA